MIENDVIGIIKTKLKKISKKSMPEETEKIIKPFFEEFKLRYQKASNVKIRQHIFSFKGNWSPYLRFAVISIMVVLTVLILTTFLPINERYNQLYAQTIEHFKTFKTISYYVELEEGLKFSVQYTDPGLVRMNSSWGIEIITDLVEEKQMILSHSKRTYFIKKIFDTDKNKIFLKELRNLPEQADVSLGKKFKNGKSLEGFQVFVHEGCTIDVWIDAGSKEITNLNVKFHEKGKVESYINIKDIELNAKMDPADFKLEPPEGYSFSTKDPNEKFYVNEF